MIYRTRLLLAGLVVLGGATSGLIACVNDSTTPADATTDGAGGNDAPSNGDVVTSDGGCSTQVADDAKGVFVAQSGTDGSTCGTRQSPCKTVQQGITNASQTTGKTTVYIASNTNPYVESVTLSAGITLEGGWNASGATWTPICDTTMSTAVTIQGTTNTTVTASYNGSATLRHVKIVSKNPADPSESLYGVFASGSSTNLTLDQIVVSVFPGGAGSDGDAGVGGANANGICAPSTGAAGSTGSTGAGGQAGTFTATGYVTSDGLGGGTGTAGANGTPGGAGACSPSAQCVTACSIGQCNFTAIVKCAGDGGAGCGGSPGNGGVGGKGGGGSLAVYVWDAHVTVASGSLTSGNGGNGGNGGVGGDGGTGSNGVVGQANSCVTNASCSGGNCSFIAGYTLDGGAAGGKGGTGGSGGSGGGGAGGPSYAIVLGGDGGVSLSGPPTFAHGTGGTGGTAGGATGLAADRWP